MTKIGTWAMNPLFYAMTIAMLFVSSCSNPPDYTEHILPSGKVVKLVSVGVMNFSDEGDAYYVNYISSIPFDDTAAVGKEADEIWEYAKIDADQGGYEVGALQASTPLRGFIIKRGKSYGLMYKKIFGQWARISPKRNSARDSAQK